MGISVKGFTLAELVITVAIVGILSTIAIPSYQESVRRSKRAEAQTAIVGAAQAMERYYTINNTYVGATLTGSTAIFPANVPAGSTKITYVLSLSAQTANNYTITATRNGTQASDKCGNFTLTGAGVRGLTSNTKAVADCWR